MHNTGANAEINRIRGVCGVVLYNSAAPCSLLSLTTIAAGVVLLRAARGAVRVLWGLLCGGCREGCYDTIKRMFDAHQTDWSMRGSIT